MDSSLPIIDSILTGDCRTLGASIPDESVDAIICDPVYNLIWQYEWLAAFAGRVLRPGGNLIAEAGHIYRFEAECACLDERLIKRPLIEEIFTGGFTQIWMHKCWRASSPFIWLEKGKDFQGRKWLPTSIYSDRDKHSRVRMLRNHQAGRAWIPTNIKGKRDKTRHKWGDGERIFEVLIDRLTKPGDLVLDPFTGSGTVPAVCRRMNRHYLAFELDPKTAERARRRVAETQIPMLLQARGREELALW